MKRKQLYQHLGSNLWDRLRVQLANQITLYEGNAIMFFLLIELDLKLKQNIKGHIK